MHSLLPILFHWLPLPSLPHSDPIRPSHWVFRAWSKESLGDLDVGVAPAELGIRGSASGGTFSGAKHPSN